MAYCCMTCTHLCGRLFKTFKCTCSHKQLFECEQILCVFLQLKHLQQHVVWCRVLQKVVCLRNEFPSLPALWWFFSGRRCLVRKPFDLSPTMTHSLGLLHSAAHFFLAFSNIQYISSQQTSTHRASHCRSTAYLLKWYDAIHYLKLCLHGLCCTITNSSAHYDGNRSRKREEHSSFLLWKEAWMCIRQQQDFNVVGHDTLYPVPEERCMTMLTL